MTKTGFLVATTAIGLVLGATQAHTAGYAIKETSATQVGQAFAGSGALKGDVSAMWNNPATMTTLKGHHFAAAASVILPSAKFKEGGSSTDQNSNKGGDGGEKAVVPALYAMWSLQDNMKLGLAVTSPFGLATKYSANSRFRHQAIKSELKSLNINPNFAYKLNDYVSLGMGVSFQYVKVELTKKWAMNQDLITTTGKDWSAGFNVGALFKPWDGGRFGIAYRSKITHGLEGDMDTSATAAAQINGAIVGGGGANPALTANTKITAEMVTPDTLDFSYAQDIGEAWTLLASAVYTRWNHFNELHVKSKANANTISNERQGWKNVWFFALGANWKVAENWMLRAGVAYDQSPINDAHRTVKLPGNDRTWLSAGVDWNFADWGKVALTYTHIFVKDGKIDQGTAATGGRVQGKMKNKVDIVGVQANFKF